MRIATALIITALTIISVPAIADDSEAEYQAVVWFYTEDGTALYFTRTAAPGTTLGEVLNGSLGAVAHWVDVSTGYEFHKDEAITKDLILRASTDEPPQEPRPEPRDYTGTAVWIILGVLVAGVLIRTAWVYMRR